MQLRCNSDSPSQKTFFGLLAHLCGNLVGLHMGKASGLNFLLVLCAPPICLLLKMILWWLLAHLCEDLAASCMGKASGLIFFIVFHTHSSTVHRSILGAGVECQPKGGRVNEWLFNTSDNFVAIGLCKPSSGSLCQFHC